MLFVRFYAQIQSKKLKAYTLVKNKTILYNILPLIRININIKMAFFVFFFSALGTISFQHIKHTENPPDMPEGLLSPVCLLLYLFKSCSESFACCYSLIVRSVIADNEIRCHYRAGCLSFLVPVSHPFAVSPAIGSEKSDSFAV